MISPLARLHIGLSPEGITLVRTDGIRRVGHALLADVPLPHDAGVGTVQGSEPYFAALAEVMKQTGCGGMRARIVLADEAARYFMVRLPRNSVRIADCLAAARQRFAALYSEAPDGWEFSAHWDARRDFLACAVPGVLRGTLLRLARESKLRVSSIVPHFIAAANQWRRHLHSDAWLAVLHRRQLTIGIAHARGWAAVRSQGVSDAARLGDDWPARYVAREALLRDMAPPRHIAVCGRHPEHYLLHAEEGAYCSRLAAPGRDTGLESEGVMLALSGGRF